MPETTHSAVASATSVEAIELSTREQVFTLDEVTVSYAGKPAVADVTLSSFSGFGKRQLTAFTADAGGKVPAGKQAGPFNALVAEALAANKAAPEKLSPDVEAAARRIGRGAGDKIVAYGKTQGWFGGGAEEGAAEAAPAAEEKPAKPAAKPATARTAAAKPEAKPVAPKPAARAAKPKPAAKAPRPSKSMHSCRTSRAAT